MKQTRQTRQEQDRKILSGIDEYFVAAKSVTIAGKDYTLTDLKQLFQAELDAALATDAAKAQLKLLVVAERQVRARVNPIRNALHGYVAVTYGDPSQALLDFGFPPKKKAVVSPETKAQAKAKRNATRKARHIMGPRQRRQITVATPASAADPGAATNGTPPAATPPATKG